MTQSMGVDSDALMGKMRAASYGAVKDFDLMKSANQAMVGAGKEFGKEFAENLPTLMQVSREAAKAQGLSVDYMYNSIVTGIKRMSPMILDNLGFQISLGEAQDKYAAKIGKTSAELSKEEKQIALLNEVTRLGTDLIEQSGGHVDSLQKSVTAWGTALANVKDRVGIALLPVLQKFMDLIGKPGQGMQDAIVKVAEGFVQWLLPAIDKITLAISVLLNGPLAMLIKGLASIGLGGLTSIGTTLSGMLTGGDMDMTGFVDAISRGLEPLLGPDMARDMAQKAGILVDHIQVALAPIRDWINENIIPAFNSITGVIQGISDTLQGGDFPWEDVLPPDLANLAYNLVGSLSAITDAIGKMFSGDMAGGGAQLQAAITQMISDAFGPGTGEAVVGFIGGLVQAFNDALPAINDFIGTMTQAFNDNLPTVLDILGRLGVLVTNVFNTILTVAAAVWPYVQAIITTAWNVISTTFEIFYTQIFPVLLAGFMTVLNWVNTNWPTIQAIIVTVMTAIGEIILAVMNTVGPFIISTFQGIADWVTENWPAIQETITIVLNFILALVQAVLTTIAQFWADYGTVIMDVVTATWETIKTIITSAIAIIEDVLVLIMAIIRGDWQTAWDAIVDILKRIWEVIKSVINLAIAIIKAVLTAAWIYITDDITKKWNAIRSFITELWESMKKIFNDALEALKLMINNAMTSIKNAWEESWNGIYKIVVDIWDRIKHAIADGINGAIRIINRFIRAANSVIKHVPGASLISELDEIELAQGGILNRPILPLISQRYLYHSWVQAHAHRSLTVLVGPTLDVVMQWRHAPALLRYYHVSQVQHP